MNDGYNYLDGSNIGIVPVSIFQGANGRLSAGEKLDGRRDEAQTVGCRTFLEVLGEIFREDASVRIRSWS